MYATTINNLAAVSMAAGRYEEAERFFKRHSSYMSSWGKRVGTLSHRAQQPGRRQLYGR